MPFDGCSIDEHTAYLEQQLAVTRAVKSRWPDAIRTTIRVSGKEIEVFAVPNIAAADAQLFVFGDEIHLYEKIEYEYNGQVRQANVFVRTGFHGQHKAYINLVLDALQRDKPNAYAALVAKVREAQQ